MKHDYASYSRAGCRCDVCKASHAAYNRNQKAIRANPAQYPTVDEVRQWVRSLGLGSVPHTLRGRTAEILVARYNREHPDRPYIRPSEREAS